MTIGLGIRLSMRQDVGRTGPALSHRHVGARTRKEHRIGNCISSVQCRLMDLFIAVTLLLNLSRQLMHVPLAVVAVEYKYFSFQTDGLRRVVIRDTSIKLRLTIIAKYVNYRKHPSNIFE